MRPETVGPGRRFRAIKAWQRADDLVRQSIDRHGHFHEMNCSGFSGSGLMSSVSGLSSRRGGCHG